MVERLQKKERQCAGGGDRPRRATVQKTQAESDDSHCGDELRKIVHGGASGGMGVRLFEVVLPDEDEEAVETAERSEEECQRE